MNVAEELRKLNQELLVKNAQLEALVKELTENQPDSNMEEQNTLLRKLLKEVL